MRKAVVETFYWDKFLAETGEPRRLFLKYYQGKNEWFNNFLFVLLKLIICKRSGVSERVYSWFLSYEGRNQLIDRCNVVL